MEFRVDLRGVDLATVNWDALAPLFPAQISRENLVKLVTMLQLSVGSPSLSAEEQNTVKTLITGFSRILELWENVYVRL
jgi:hypothetical protein